MATAYPFELINPIPQGADTFTDFDKLPPELRQRIWEQSLCHERLVRVSMLHRPCSEDTGNVFDHHGPVLLNEHEISKLFRVSRESRQAAQRFYRVQVPCFYIDRHREPAPGTFYFHPELDTLHIGGSHCCLVDFANFADRLWRHDPKRVGLINIALTSTHRCNMSHDLMFRPRGQQNKELLRSVLARLRCVIFGHTEEIDGHFPLLSSSSHLEGSPELPGQQAWLERQHRIRRSYPRLAPVSKFDRLPLDPRDIDAELKRIYIGAGNPRVQMYSWFKGLSEWDITYEQPEEQGRWELYRQSCAKNGAPCGNDEQAPPSAFGFWLFPIDAFGTIPSPTEEESEDSPARLESLMHREDSHPDDEWDLSERKPELCLQYLPA